MLLTLGLSLYWQVASSRASRIKPAYVDFYPFFNWRLIPFPMYYDPRTYLRLYYLNEEQEWQKLSLQEKNYLNVLSLSFKKYEKGKLSKAELKYLIDDFIPKQVSKFKIVEETYMPLQFIKDQNDFSRKDILLFRR